MVPGSLRFVTEELHEKGHKGSEKLYERIQKKFYWPNLYRYVQYHVTQCDACQKCKPSNRPARAPLLPVQDPESPMQLIAIDIGYMVIDDEGY